MRTGAKIGVAVVVVQTCCVECGSLRVNDLRQVSTKLKHKPGHYTDCYCQNLISVQNKASVN